MIHLIRYLTILENADRIVKGFGTYPDPEDQEYIAARQIYDLAFAELLRAGMPFERRGDVIVIATDGVEYGYVYREGEEEESPDRKKEYMASEPNGSSLYSHAEEGEDKDLPAEIDENEMEDSDLDEPEEAEEGTWGSPDEGPGAEEAFPPEPARPEEDAAGRGGQDLQGTADTEEETLPPEPAPGDMEEPGFHDMEEPGFREMEEPEFPDMEEPHFPEEEPSGDGEPREIKMAEPDFPEVGPDEKAPETAEEDGPDAVAAAEKPDVEAIETEPDENAAYPGQMPTRLKALDHTMASHRLQITDARPSSKQKDPMKTNVLSMPLSIDTEYPRILALIMERGGVKTAVSQKGRNYVRLSYRNIPIVVSGRMENGRYVSECRLGGSYGELGYSLESEDKTYGTMGHVVMDDDEGDTHVHFMPIGFSNAPEKRYANFCYLIEEKGREQIGSSIGLNGSVPVMIEGKKCYMSASWSEDREFLCHILDA